MYSGKKAFLFGVFISKSLPEGRPALLAGRWNFSYYEL
jgi:hypothetical protein